MQMSSEPGSSAYFSDLSDDLLDEVVGGNPVYCPVAASMSPGVPGVVDIDSTGDTSVAGQFIYDCPPLA